MAWSLWSACDDSGLQMRSRVCGAQGNIPCVGNSTQRRDCNEIPGESVNSQIYTVPVQLQSHRNKSRLAIQRLLKSRTTCVSFAEPNIIKFLCWLC